MLPEEITKPLRVCCECGRWLSVEPMQAGSALTCTCGRRVVVPNLEEFQERSDLLSAMTIERRIPRLIAAGELPPSDGCARCGLARTADFTPIRLECERYTARSGGGQRLLIVPLFSALLWVWWREEEWVEIHGRDTDVFAPLCLCDQCRRHLRGRAGDIYWLTGALAIAVGMLVGIANIVAGIGVAAVGVLGVLLWRWIARRTRQRELKQLLRRVPVYRQVLADYPDTIVVVAPESAVRRLERPG
jgi:hypothetical protein